MINWSKASTSDSIFVVVVVVVVVVFIMNGGSVLCHIVPLFIRKRANKPESVYAVLTFRTVYEYHSLKEHALYTAASF